MHTQAEASPVVDDSDGEVAESPSLSSDIVHNSIPQQTTQMASIAAKIKGGNIATAADSLVHEITAERGVFKNSVLQSLRHLDVGRPRDHKPNKDSARSHLRIQSGRIQSGKSLQNLVLQTAYQSRRGARSMQS